MNISTVKPLYSAERIEVMRKKSEISHDLMNRARALSGTIARCPALATEIPQDLQIILKMVACRNDDFFRASHSNPAAITNMIERRVKQLEVYCGPF